MNKYIPFLFVLVFCCKYKKEVDENIEHRINLPIKFNPRCIKRKKVKLKIKSGRPAIKNTIKPNNPNSNCCANKEEKIPFPNDKSINKEKNNYKSNQTQTNKKDNKIIKKPKKVKNKKLKKSKENNIEKEYILDVSQDVSETSLFTREKTDYQNIFKWKQYIFYIIRHGEALHNEIKYNGNFFAQRKRLFLNDPPLSEKGKYESIIAGKKLKQILEKIDLVITSSMSRAIETALLMFPKEKKIIPIIGLKENTIFGRFCQENQISKTIEKQLKKMKIKNNDRINYEYIKDKKTSNGTGFRKEAKRKSNMKSALAFIAKIHKKLIKNYKDKKTIKIAIIGHSRVFKKYFKTKDKLNNNGIVELKFYLKSNFYCKSNLNYFKNCEQLIYKGINNNKVRSKTNKRIKKVS